MQNKVFYRPTIITLSIFILTLNSTINNTIKSEINGDSKMEKVVLAFSGGLDTSVCIKLLEEKYDKKVVTACVDVGQPESRSF